MQTEIVETSVGEKVKVLAIKYFIPAVKGFLIEGIDTLAEPELRKIVEKSETKIDDMVVAAMYPELEKIVKAQVEAQLAKVK